LVIAWLGRCVQGTITSHARRSVNSTLGAAPLQDGQPIAHARADPKLLNGEADHVFGRERAGRRMEADEVALDAEAGFKVDMRECLLGDVRMPWKASSSCSVSVRTKTYA
jgi:hypothetical protein